MITPISTEQHWTSFDYRQYFSIVFIISLHRTDDIPPSHWWYPSIVLNTLNSTENISPIVYVHKISPPYWWYPSVVLNIFYRTTHFHSTAHALPKVETKDRGEDLEKVNGKMRGKCMISLQVAIRLPTGCHKRTMEFNYKFNKSIQLSLKFN